MAITSPEKGCLDVNDEICTILGYERRELLGMTWAQLTHPDDLDLEVASFERVMAGELDGYVMDKRFIRSDGQAIDTTISVKCVRREDGSVDYFVALLQDITSRKRAEEALAKSNAELETRVAERTRQLEALNEELMKEIAERTRAQEHLRRSEAYLAESERISHVGSWAWQPTGEIFWSLEQFRIFGVDPRSYDPDPGTMRLFIHPEDWPLIKHDFHRAVSAKSNFETEFRIVLADGSIKHARCVGHPVLNESGDLMEYVGALMDVTERTWAEMESLALRDALGADLTAMTRLHNFSTRLLKSTELTLLLEEVLNAIMELQEADFGNVQMYNPENKALEIVVQRGFPQEFLDHFASVRDDAAACGRALKNRERVIIEDVETDPDFAPHRDIAAHSGYRAVQSTPLFSRLGEPLGMVSTHFRRPHRPSDHQLRFTDLYAAHAAEIIERKQTETTVLRYQQELQKLTAKLIEVQETEGKYLARELHDDVSQKLAVLGMDVGRLAECPCTSQQELRGRLLNFTTQLAILANDIHRISRQLHPAILDDLGLAAALKNECIAFSEQHGVAIEFDPDDIPRDIPDDTSLCLYRVAQESLRNISKHAAATRVHVTLTAPGRDRPRNNGYGQRI